MQEAHTGLPRLHRAGPSTSLDKIRRSLFSLSVTGWHPGSLSPVHLPRCHPWGRHYTMFPLGTQIGAALRVHPQPGATLPLNPDPFSPAWGRTGMPIGVLWAATPPTKLPSSHALRSVWRQIRAVIDGDQTPVGAAPRQKRNPALLAGGPALRLSPGFDKLAKAPRSSGRIQPAAVGAPRHLAHIDVTS